MKADMNSELFCLKQMQSEMRRKFDRWDEHINAGMHPVPIQDLDFWAVELGKIIKSLEGKQ